MIQTNLVTLDPPSDLTGHNINASTEALNIILADLFALYVKTKNFHWHMTGPHFRDYHLLLDDQATQIFSVVDNVAERIRKTGRTTLRSIGDIGRRQRIRDNDAEFVSPEDMLAELHHDNLALVEAFREAKLLVDYAKDNATSGLLDGWTDQAEQRAWFSSRPPVRTDKKSKQRRRDVRVRRCCLQNTLISNNAVPLLRRPDD